MEKEEFRRLGNLTRVTGRSPEGMVIESRSGVLSHLPFNCLCGGRQQGYDVAVE